jgi:hypothetical protein
MRTVRQTLTAGGTLLTALVISTSYSAAQDTGPTLRTLYNFTGGSGGGNPFASVVVGPDGVLYGTTDGGTTSNGTVFSLTPPASPGGAWTETVLHSFAGAPTDGANPFAPVVIGPGGVLYGTTNVGGTSNNGTVFALNPPATPGGAWTETVLHSFAGSPDDGANPQVGVVIGGAGVIYGTTAGGGISACIFGGCGTVFSLKTPASPGSSWTETVLYHFNNSEGSNPEGGLVIGNGVLYGTTYFGGTSSNGTVFSLTPPVSPGGAWTEAVLHDFTPLSGDGTIPAAGVVIGSGGVLYGTTFSGGTFDFGTAFSLTPPTSPGGPWTETLLHNFGSSSHDGTSPLSALVIGSGGVLYGTTEDGGSTSSGCGFTGCGTVFVLTPPGSAGGAWTESILHYFNSTDGACHCSQFLRIPWYRTGRHARSLLLRRDSLRQIHVSSYTTPSGKRALLPPKRTVEWVEPTLSSAPSARAQPGLAYDAATQVRGGLRPVLQQVARPSGTGRHSQVSTAPGA